jgi:ATP/ADP translocase
MILSRIGWELAVLVTLVVLCVVGIFFFPAIQGPYSAVNGPVTALQSARSAARVRVAIVQAAFKLIGNFQLSALAWVNLATIVYIEPQSLVCVDCSILRC